LVSVRGRHTGECGTPRDTRRPAGGPPAPDPQSTGVPSCLGPRVARWQVRSRGTLRPMPLSHRHGRYSHAALWTPRPNESPLLKDQLGLRREEICAETKNTQFGGYAVRGDASQFYSWMVQAHREVLDGHGAPEDGQRQERRPKGGGEDTQICQEHIETGYCAVQRKESW
jgi:hypothetical protein